MIHAVRFAHDSYRNFTVKPLKSLTVGTRPARARLGAAAVTCQQSHRRGTSGGVRGEMLSQPAQHRPASRSSPVSLQLPKTSGEEKAELVAHQVAGSSSLASSAQLLGQKSSDARSVYNTSILNSDDCRCLRGGCSAIADELTTYFGIGNFTLQISAPAYCALFPIARLRHATLQARGHSIKAQKRWGKLRCVQPLLGIFQGNSTSPALHDCLNRNGCLASH